MPILSGASIFSLLQKSYRLTNGRFTAVLLCRRGSYGGGKVAHHAEERRPGCGAAWKASTSRALSKVYRKRWRMPFLAAGSPTPPMRITCTNGEDCCHTVCEQVPRNCSNPYTRHIDLWTDTSTGYMVHCCCNRTAVCVCCCLLLFLTKGHASWISFRELM